MLKKLKIGIATVALLELVAFPKYVQEAEYVAPKVLAVKTTQEPVKTIPQLVEVFATKYQVSAPQMLATMRCESGLNPKAVGDHGTSHGIAQIHLTAWKNITIKQAQDPAFAAEFMAQQFAKGNQRAWTCWRQIYT